MSFCPHCGHSVYDGAKFCPECGKPLIQAQSQTQRKKVFEGDIHICPHCSEPLGAFDLVCPACGREIRNREASTAVQNFADEIAALEAERTSPNIPVPEDAEGGKPSRSARRKARENIDRQIASRIQNFPIPNTKEDLFEFLILSSSNISEDRYSNRISKGEKTISDAWKSKFEQAYQKAKISFGKTPEFENIKSIYEEKRKSEEEAKKIEELSKRKAEHQKSIQNMFDNIELMLMLIGLFAVLLMVCFVILKTTVSENSRLDAIVDEIYECIEAGDYTLARAKAASLVFSGPYKKAEEKWESKRQEIYAIIDRAEGIESGTVPDIQEAAGTNNDTSAVKDEPEEKESEGFFSSVVDGFKNIFGD